MTIGNGHGFDESHLCQNAYTYGQVSPCRVSKELYPEQVKQDYVLTLVPHLTIYPLTLTIQSTSSMKMVYPLRIPSRYVLPRFETLWTFPIPGM